MVVLNSQLDGQLWHRQPGEPAAAYEAFCAYRDLEAKSRSIIAAYRQLRRSDATRANGTWNEWSSRFRWPERVKAYDHHVHGLEHKADEQRVRRRARQEATTGAAAASKPLGLRFPRESSAAYAAFCAYRDLPISNRSITAAYHQFRNFEKSNTTQATERWKDWFRRFHWRKRAEAHDDHVAEVDVIAREKLRKELAAQRFDYEIARMDAQENRLAQIRLVIHLFRVDVQQFGIRGMEWIRTEIVDGRKIKTTIKRSGFKAGGFCNLTLQQADLAAVLINGPRRREIQTKESRVLPLRATYEPFESEEPMSPSQWKMEGCPFANDLTAEIWLRLPNETAKAYQAFRAYQELPASDRSIVAAYGKMKNAPGPNPTKAPGTWMDRARRFRWSERVEACEAHCQAVEQKRLEERLRDLPRRRLDAEVADMADAMLQVASMDLLLDKYEEDAKLGLRDRSQSRTEIVKGRKKTTAQTFKAVRINEYVAILKGQSKLECSIMTGLGEPAQLGALRRNDPPVLVAYSWGPPEDDGGTAVNDRRARDRTVENSRTPAHPHRGRLKLVPEKKRTGTDS
jgi:hypothetical protein